MSACVISLGFEASRTLSVQEGRGRDESHCGHRTDGAPRIYFVGRPADDGVRVGAVVLGVVRVGVVVLGVDGAKIEVLGCGR